MAITYHDTNNQGVYVRVKKNGTYTDVQIA